MIKTPEGYSFAITLADPVRRFHAWLLDVIICFVLVTMLSSLAAAIMPGDALVKASMATTVFFAYNLIRIAYGVVCELCFSGRTIGKLCFGLRVVDEHGYTLRLRQIFLRNLLILFDSLPILWAVGGVSMFFTQRNQRLGDIVANTVVICSPTYITPDISSVLTDKYNSFRKLPNVQIQLRQKITPALAQVGLQALMRRDSLNPAARVEVFKEVADVYKKLVKFPAETLETLSDEKLVFNIIDTIYQNRK